MTVTQTSLTIGTRGSALARWQSDHVAGMIEAANPGVRCRIVTLSTAGDRELDKPIPEIGGKGVFTRELEAALGAGEIDLAIHSLKDLPTVDPPGLVLAAICSRADPRDVLVSRDYTSLSSLPTQARVGTSSPRRKAQLLALRRDIACVPLRGNVDTRVRKAETGEYDAVVIAAAGVDRLGLESHVRQRLPLESVLPAPGQGALAVQCRAEDSALRSLIARIDDPACRAATTAERVFLEELGGGCAVPVAAHAASHGSGPDAALQLRGVVAALDGSRVMRSVAAGRSADAQRLGGEAASQIVRDGGRELLA